MANLVIKLSENNETCPLRFMKACINTLNVQKPKHIQLIIMYVHVYYKIMFTIELWAQVMHAILIWTPIKCLSFFHITYKNKNTRTFLNFILGVILVWEDNIFNISGTAGYLINFQLGLTLVHWGEWFAFCFSCCALQWYFGTWKIGPSGNCYDKQRKHISNHYTMWTLKWLFCCLGLLFF